MVLVFFLLLALMLIYLKLTGRIKRGWFIVLWPIWLPILAYMIFISAYVGLMAHVLGGAAERAGHIVQETQSDPSYTGKHPLYKGGDGWD